MRKELFYYACPPNRARQASTSSTNKKASITLFLCIGLVFLILSVPMLIYSPLLWLVCLTTYIICLLYSKRDKDPYSKTMFYLFLNMAFIGIILSYGLNAAAKMQFQIVIWQNLIISTIIGIIFYEFGVFINVLFKKYSNKDKKTYAPSATSTFFGTLLGFNIGRRISHMNSQNIWHIYISLVGCSLVLSVAFVFLQKYLIYKIVKNKQS